MYTERLPERIDVKGYENSDCTINAIGNALLISYDLSEKILQTGSYSNGSFTFNSGSPRVIEELISRRNVRMTCDALSVDSDYYLSDEELVKRIKNDEPLEHKKDYKLVDFMSDNKDGTYLVLLDQHLTVVIDGELIDTYDSSQSSVQIAYKVDITKARDIILELAKHYQLNSKKHILTLSEAQSYSYAEAC